MADTIGNLNYKLGVDTQQFTTGLFGAGSRIEKFAKDTRAQSAGIESAFSGLRTATSNIFSGFGNGGAGGIAAVKGEITGLLSTLAGSAGPVGIFAASLTAGLVAVVTQAREATKEIASITKFARSIGDSIPNSQVLLRVFELSGLERPEAQQNLMRLFDRMADLRANPDSSLGRNIASIGLQPQAIGEAFRSGNSVAALEEIFVALQNTDDVLTRNSASAGIFGRSFVQMAGGIDRARENFVRAREDVERFGDSLETINRASQANSIWRQLERENGTIGQRVGRDYNTIMTGISLDLANATRATTDWSNENKRLSRTLLEIASFTPYIQLSDRPESIIPQGFLAGGSAITNALNPATNPFAADPTRTANENAIRLTKSWMSLREVIGLSSREVAIFRAEQSGASKITIDALRRENDLSIQAERNAQIQAELRSVEDVANAWRQQADAIGLSNRQAIIQRQIRLGQTADVLDELASLDQILTRREQFARLAQQMAGQPGGMFGQPGSLGITGITANSIESARLFADAQTRRNGGPNDPQAQQQALLQGINDVLALMEQHERAIAEAIANGVPLLPAPIN